jgi:lysine 2,3-aminomutase
MNEKKPPHQFDQAEDLDVPPGRILRQGVSDADWHDWRWQLAHSLSKPSDFSGIIDLLPEELQALQSPGLFKIGVTPYFASLIDPNDPNCPIRRQVIPTIAEKHVSLDEMADSLGEESHSPVPGLIHRYPDRVLMLINSQCAGYCRFCTRSRLVGDPHHQFTNKDYQQQIDYIAANPAVRDVLLSGGDPLILPQNVLESILKRIREIPHVEVIRIGTRVPVYLPMRIDAELVQMLSKYHPLWMNIHFNHPKEITPEVKRALSLLANAGIPLGSQTVLLAGINDCPQTMKQLFHQLVKSRVRPYYLYQCDQVPGSSHFRTSISAGVEIIESLRGHTSGFAIPTFVIDAPEGGGKVPIFPQYLISNSDRTAVVRNYEGLITAYHQPAGYIGHDSSNCPACLSAAVDGQEGVSALLSGHKRSILPEAWSASHQRSVPLPDSLQPRKKVTAVLKPPRQITEPARLEGTNRKSVKRND